MGSSFSTPAKTCYNESDDCWYIEEVDCTPYIEESDFQQKIRRGVNSNDLNVLRGGMTLLGDHPCWVWKNAAIRCIGDGIDYIFFSGSRTNKFVVCLSEHNEVHKRCTNSGWLLKIRNTVMQVWGGIKAAFAVAAPAVVKAIMYH